MDIREGEIFRHSTDGVVFTVKQIVNNMVVLESQDGNRRILTEIDTLRLKSFYLKGKHKELWNKTFDCPSPHM